MTRTKILTAASSLILGLGLVSGSMLAQAEKGPADAVAVCEAVARDDSSEVTRLLANYRAPFEYAYTHLAPGPRGMQGAKDAYECNGLTLDNFAKRIGAAKTAALFNGQSANEQFVAEASNLTDSKS